MSDPMEQWRESIARARQKRQKTEKNAPAGSKDDLDAKLDNALKGIGTALSQTVSKLGVAGTFNVSAVWGLSGGNAIDRTAQATEETARNTKKMLKEMKETPALKFT